MAPYVTLLDLWGDSQLLDLADGLAFSELPLALRSLGRVGMAVAQGSTTYYLRGTQQEIAQQCLGQAENFDNAGTSYVPTLTSSGAGVLVALGTWRALRCGGEIHVIGQFTFAPAVAGTAETISMTLPPSTDFAPDTNFADTSSLLGVAHTTGATTATDVIGQPIAQVGAKKADMVIDQTAPGATVYGVAFCYSSPS